MIGLSIGLALVVFALGRIGDKLSRIAEALETRKPHHQPEEQP